MAHRLTWLPAALEDVDAIAAYISIDSPRYADNFVARVFAKAEGLCDLPTAGHLTPEAEQDGVREIPVYPYRLIYRVKEKRVIVLAVLHGSRLIETLIQDRLK